MEMVRAAPAPGLRPLIAHYHGYHERGAPPGRHRGLPSPYLTLIVTLEEPLTVTAHPDPGQSPGRYDALVGGLHTAPALITHEGRQAGVQLALSPLGARALLGVPAGELRNLDVDAGDLLGPAARELHGRLNSASGWAERFAVLDESLLRHADLERAVPAEVVRAWRLLTSSGGGLTVSELARDVGWSSRHLRARFTAEIGLTPKAAARVIRFDRARRRLQSLTASAGSGGVRHSPPRVTSGAPPATSRQEHAGRPAVPALADLAAECGYYDQAHLAREFRDLAGCAPSRWLAEEFRFVQAAAPASRGDSTA
ncbi:helix-turn-helix domain-containing protein [Sphaerisporangium fuscum]|uniref:helix-turn-helix domain-containing protein n=1 Tax=Sphaerisporangium fuscum TaxID=2835868 RepID=UPI001BDCAAA3|nr:helix-turn-helix domain-containing protein [Sphaerisporangium fuscum]